VAALAQLTAATTGILTTPAKDGPFGFCHFAARPVIGSPWTPSLSASPEGIGPVWQLTAVETATRYGIGTLVAGDNSARDAASFVDHLPERLAGIGVERTAVLTDNGPEFTGRGFTSHLKDLAINHHRIPPRSPNHNAVGERFQAPPSRSSTGRPSTASTSLAWPTWAPSSRAGSRPTTLAAATTATSCAAAHPLRSWRPTYHDQAKGPPVTSTRAQEELDAVTEEIRRVTTLIWGGGGHGYQSCGVPRHVALLRHLGVAAGQLGAQAFIAYITGHGREGHFPGRGA